MTSDEKKLLISLKEFPLVETVFYMCIVLSMRFFFFFYNRHWRDCFKTEHKNDDVGASARARRMASYALALEQIDKATCLFFEQWQLLR